MELQMHERATLDQIVTWGTDPVVEADVERLERLHEAALAELPEDLVAYGDSEGGQ